MIARKADTKIKGNYNLSIVTESQKDYKRHQPSSGETTISSSIPLASLHPRTHLKQIFCHSRNAIPTTSKCGSALLPSQSLFCLGLHWQSLDNLSSDLPSPSSMVRSLFLLKWKMTLSLPEVYCKLGRRVMLIARALPSVRGLAPAVMMPTARLLMATLTAPPLSESPLLSLSIALGFLRLYLTLA